MGNDVDLSKLNVPLIFIIDTSKIPGYKDGSPLPNPLPLSAIAGILAGKNTYPSVDIENVVESVLGERITVAEAELVDKNLTVDEAQHWLRSRLDEISGKSPNETIALHPGIAAILEKYNLPAGAIINKLRISSHDGQDFVGVIALTWLINTPEAEKQADMPMNLEHALKILEKISSETPKIPLHHGIEFGARADTGKGLGVPGYTRRQNE